MVSTRASPEGNPGRDWACASESGVEFRRGRGLEKETEQSTLGNESQMTLLRGAAWRPYKNEYLKKRKKRGGSRMEPVLGCLDRGSAECERGGEGRRYSVGE